jgi:hypothetical protein
MKREHTAYFEYFVDPVPKSTDWAWRTLIHRIPASAGPTEELKGTASDRVAARKAGQAAGVKGIEKHRIPKVDLTKTVEEGK